MSNTPEPQSGQSTVATAAAKVVAVSRKPSFLPLVLISLIALLGGALIGSTGAFNQMTGNGDATGMVAFDTVKLLNAQRAVASRIIGAPNTPAANDASVLLAKVSKEAAVVVQKHAAGRAVVVKQALALPASVPDITDEVLTELGLPTDVPTITPPADGVLGDTAFSTSEFYKKLQEETRNQRKEHKEWLKDARAKATEEALP